MTEGAVLLEMIRVLGTRRILDCCAHLPHPFMSSGEYVGVGVEVCAVCRMGQRGTYIHPEGVYSPTSAPQSERKKGST